MPGEPFLPYVTGQDAGGHAFQRVVSNLIQPQSVSIVPPLRQDLHPGVTTTYAFTVMNLGDAGTFNLTATDDKGFIASADPSQADIPAERIGRPDCRSPAAREHGGGHLRCADGPGRQRDDTGTRELRFLGERGPRARGGAHHHVHQLEHIDDECPLDHDDDRGGLHDHATGHVVVDDDHDSMHDRSLHDRRWSPRGSVRKPGRAAGHPEEARSRNEPDRRGTRQRAEEGAASAPQGEVAAPSGGESGGESQPRERSRSSPRDCAVAIQRVTGTVAGSLQP